MSALTCKSLIHLTSSYGNVALPFSRPNVQRVLYRFLLESGREWFMFESSPSGRSFTTTAHVGKQFSRLLLIKHLQGVHLIQTMNWFTKATPRFMPSPSAAITEE